MFFLRIENLVEGCFIIFLSQNVTTLIRKFIINRNIEVYIYTGRPRASVLRNLLTLSNEQLQLSSVINCKLSAHVTADAAMNVIMNVITLRLITVIYFLSFWAIILTSQPELVKRKNGTTSNDLILFNNGWWLVNDGKLDFSYTIFKLNLFSCFLSVFAE